MKIEVMVEIPDGKYCNKCAFQAADSSESAICVFDWSADMITECTFCDTETCEGCTKDTGLLKIDNCPALLAQLEPDGWISVENQLPDAKGHYLTIGKINWAHGGSGEGNDGDARRNMIISYFDSTGMFNHPHATHWRPLPEPPREGKI